MLRQVFKSSEEVASAMNPELLVERDYILNSLQSRTQRDLGEDYDIGTKLKNISENPSVYGPGALQVLSKSLNLYSNLLSYLRKFAMVYDKNDLEELRALNGPDGLPFPWTIHHIRLFCQLRKVNQRKALQQKCASGGWSMRQLHAAVRKLVPASPRSTNSGRPPHRPKDIDAHLSLFSDMTSVWVDRVNRFGEEFMSLASTHDKWTKDERKKLNRLSQAAHAMSDRIVAMSQVLQAVQNKLNKIDQPEDQENVYRRKFIHLSDEEDDE